MLYKNIYKLCHISLIYKITIFSPQKNSNEEERKFNKKSRAEIIELYRSTMTNDNKLDRY